MSVCELLAHIRGYLVVVPVYLVAHQDPQHLGRGVLLDLPQPVGAAVEGGLVGHVVDQDERMRGPVVGLGDAPEPLLARRVPDLEFDLLPVNLHRLDHEVNPDSCSLSGGKHSLCESPHQTRLAHPCITHQHNLKEIFIIFHDEWLLDIYVCTLLVNDLTDNKYHQYG